ncbi:MAG: AIM24 family protein [Caldilineaceae bacterium]
MNNYSIQEFLTATAQRYEARGRFELENPYLLEVNLDGQIRAKIGSMIGYIGDVTFTREGMFEHGLGTLLKKAVSGEGMTLMKVAGKGRVYLADKGKKVRILQLQGDTIVINGNDLLAFEEELKWDITLMKRVAGMLAGGLFNIKLSGSGLIAMTTHYEPLTLRVTPNEPVFPIRMPRWPGRVPDAGYRHQHHIQDVTAAAAKPFSSNFRAMGRFATIRRSHDATGCFWIRIAL